MLFRNIEFYVDNPKEEGPYLLFRMSRAEENEYDISNNLFYPAYLKIGLTLYSNRQLINTG